MPRMPPDLPAAPPEQARSPPVILLVEDEVTIRFALSEYLKLSDFTVLEASNADDAIELLLTDERVDLVFSDIMMPGSLDGFGLADWIRAQRPEVPVILTSGLPQKVLEAKALCEEDAAVLPKPYALDDVGYRIRLLLAQ